MAEKRPRGYFELEDEEYSGTEMVFNTLSILESRGYHSFVELMAILNDPELILKIVRFMYGIDIKVPPLEEFNRCLRTSIFAYCDMHKNVNSSLPAKVKDIQQFMKIDEKETQEILKIFDSWAIYMNKQGHDIRNYQHINRSNTKKRIDMVTKGKRWKASKY